jgi:hypothetical protein
MRCLYCGKELALLKRLTGGGEFCSEAHKRSYQEEYNRIALTRLLQAQSKTAKSIPVPDKAAPPAVTVAVEEPVAIEEPVEYKQEEQLEEVHLEPVESAGFLLEQPASSAPTDEAPYVEPWLEVAPLPSAPTWLFSAATQSDLPVTGLLPLGLRPQVRDSERMTEEVNVTPNEFAASSVRPPVPFSLAPTNTLQGAGRITLKISPQAISSGIQVAAEAQSGGACGPAEYHGSALLSVFPSTIDFPAEDAEVAVISPAIIAVEVEPADLGLNPTGDDLAADDVVHDDVVQPDALETQGQESDPDGTPNQGLEALAKVHQQSEGEKSAVVQRVVESVVAEPEAPADALPEPVAVATAAVAAEGPSETGEPSPRASTEFVEITVRSFAPPKAVPADGAALVREKPALLPRLTGLPLRPKVALAPSQAAAPKASPAKSPAPATKESIPASAPSSGREGKPPAKPVPATPPAQPKAARPTTPRPVKPANVASTPPSTAPAAAVKVVAPAVTPAVTAAATPSNKTVPAVETAAPKAPAAKAPAAPQKPAASPVSKESPALAETATPVVETTAPTFGSMQLGSSSAWGSLKVKLGIALVLLVAAVTTYLGWGTKTRTPISSAASSADAPGPSIMVGEGGWVEGWAGDPTGAHYGRQITLYRPSLKLSDYRVEFQGQIDTNSIGWVFRAADPQNYYAMKLTQVSSGLSPKLALFKFLVANGRQTQVGRVPIDLSAGPDMMLKVRVDVRGPRFSTYVQGQQVDVWTDDQLKTGGVGFLNEREERGRIKSVSIYYLNGGNK